MGTLGGPHSPMYAAKCLRGGSGQEMSLYSFIVHPPIFPPNLTYQGTFLGIVHLQQLQQTLQNSATKIKTSLHRY